MFDNNIKESTSIAFVLRSFLSFSDWTLWPFRSHFFIYKVNLPNNGWVQI